MVTVYARMALWFRIIVYTEILRVVKMDMAVDAVIPISGVVGLRIMNGVKFCKFCSWFELNRVDIMKLPQKRDIFIFLKKNLKNSSLVIVGRDIDSSRMKTSILYLKQMMKKKNKKYM